MKPLYWLIAFVVVTGLLGVSWVAQNASPDTASSSEQRAEQPVPSTSEPSEDTPDLSVDIGSVLVDDQPKNNTTTTPAKPTTPAPKPKPTTPSGITAAQLATHNTKTDCWIAYKGEVYDLTAFLPRHPGGVSTISRYCGTADEFSAAFTRQHRSKQDSRLSREATVKGAYAA